MCTTIYASVRSLKAKEFRVDVFIVFALISRNEHEENVYYSSAIFGVMIAILPVFCCCHSKNFSCCENRSRFKRGPQIIQIFRLRYIARALWCQKFGISWLKFNFTIYIRDRYERKEFVKLCKLSSTYKRFSIRSDETCLRTRFCKAKRPHTQNNLSSFERWILFLIEPLIIFSYVSLFSLFIPNSVWLPLKEGKK